MNKEMLRSHCKEMRDCIPGRREKSLQICENLKKFPAVQKAEVVAAYYPLGSEVDLRPLLKAWEKEGKTIGLPISYNNGKMVFHAADLERLEQGMFGIFQPPETSPMLEPEKIELILVPGLAFDKTGHRIGYGKGYYDRILENFRGITIGVCYQKQITETVFPQPHDVPLTYLVNEKEVYITGKDRKDERQVNSNDR